MYKKQMALQRILCIVAIAACALVFVYGLGYMTDVYDMVYSLRESYKTDEIKQFLADMDRFNADLVPAGIGLILISLGLLLTNSHTRRKYYIGNYTAVGLYTAGALAVSVWAHTEIAAFRERYLSGIIDFEVVKSWADRSARNGGVSVYTDSTFWFDVHWFVFGLLLVVAALLVLNTVWKILLMKNEREALAGATRKAVSA